MKQFSLRMLAVTLAITLLAANFVTTITALDILESFESGNDTKRETVTVTDAQAVAKYSFVSEGEKAVLNCDAIIGEKHNIPVPSDKDDLVLIDSEKNTVSAKEFTEGGYTWVPVKAFLITQDAIGSEIETPIDLDKNGNGSFETNAESYSVEVEYEVRVEIDKDTQQMIANAPALLVNGLANLELVADCKGDLETLASDTIFDALLQMTTPTSISSSSSLTLTIFPNTPQNHAGYDAIKALEAERIANGGTFGLIESISAYNQSQNKVEYLLNNGKAYKENYDVIANSLSVIAAEFNEKMDGFRSLQSMNVVTAEDIAKLEIFETLFNNIANGLSVPAENWAVLDSNPVKQNATASELEALDLALIAAKGRVSMHDSETFVAAPVAATTTVKTGVDQNYVNVVVKAQVVDATNNISTLNGESARFLMKESASDKEISNKVEAMGVRQNSLAYWTKNAATYNVDSDHYTYSTKITRNDAGEIDVEIIYTPKTYTISFNYAEEITVPYGYRYQLENHADPSKSYDYKVNGIAKYQSDIIKISEDLFVTRAEGAALKSSSTNAIIADSLIGSLLTEEAKNVLKVNAFKNVGDEYLFGSLKYRVPTVAALETTATPNEYKVTAPSVSSGLLSGAIWNATSVDLVDENGAVLASYKITDGATKFVYSGIFETASINFELNVEDIERGSITTIANLPYVLACDAENQLAVLDRMADGSLYGALGSLSAQNINLIVTVVNASDMSQEAKDAVARLKTDCVDAAGNILLYSYLTAYKSAKAKGAGEGLKYYYTANNAANIKNQLDILSEVFNALCPDDKNNADRKIFTSLLSGNGLDSYVEKLDSIRSAIDDCKDISAVNKYVDGNSASLGALTTAIYNSIGKVSEYNGNNAVVLESSIICAAPDKSSVNVIINVLKSDGTIDSYLDTLTLSKGSFVENLLLDKFNALDKKLEINKKYYTVSGADSIPTGNVEIDSITTDVIITYAPYSYTVSVPGTADQSFYYDTDWTVTLPAPSNNSTKFIYTVAGEQIEVIGESARYTFNHLNMFNSDRHFTVTVEEVDLESEKFLTFIDLLNDAVGEAGGRFIPAKDENGNIVIVFRVSSNISSAIDSGVLANLPLALAMYDNVNLGGNLFWDGTAVHLQAMTNMVADSKFSFDLFCDIIREDGTVINDAALGALEPMVAPNGNIGGRLMASSINLDGREMGFYVTLADTTSSAMLSKMRSAVEQVKNYVNIVCDEGQFQFIITAPDAIYPYYLAQMLVSGNVDITDISALNLRESIRYEWGLIEGILSDDRLSVDTFENTFGVLGKEVDLDNFEGIFNNFKKANYYLENNIEVESYDEASDKYSGTFKIDLHGVFNRVDAKFGLGDVVMGMIYEADPEAERFEIDFSVKLANIIDKDYDAIVFDINGNGITKKFYCSNDLANVLNNLGNYGIVILTSDTVLEKDVYIPQNAIIDLNGFTLQGNISAGGTVRIVDSRLGTEEAGTFDGNLGKGSFVITGGKFTCDVTAYLNNGYYVNENGYIRNKIYSINKNGNDIELALSAAYLNETEILNFQTVLADIAVDIAMSSYNGSAIAIDGNYIYSFAAKDITSILGSGKAPVVNSIIDILNTEGLSYVINSVFTDVTDFEKLASAINNNEALVEYELSIENWNIVSYIAEGNYITFDSVPSNKETGKFTVVIEGTTEDKEELAQLCTDLSAIEVEAFNININDVSYGNGFSVDFDGEVNVHVNLAKNRAYAALICAAAAYNSNNPIRKDTYIAALEYYLNDKGTNAIVAAIESMTAAEVISAFKSISYVSCDTMLNSIGLGESDKVDGIARLFASYDNLVQIATRVINKLGISGNGARLVDRKVNNTYSTYRFQRELVGRINVTLTLTTVPPLEEMEFNKPTIDTTDSTVTEVLKGSDQIEFEDGSHGIAVDVHQDGVGVDKFIDMLNITVEGAIKVDIAIYDKDGNKKSSGLVCTGDIITVTAFDGVDYVTKEHTVVIVGDTNCNGRTDIGDAVKIAAYNKGTIEMSEAEIKASDTNCNGRTDIGDAVKIASKAKNWEQYESSYTSNN